MITKGGKRMFEYNSRIGFSQCDAEKRLMLSGLIDMFQDCSTFQSEDLGVGFDALENRGLAWVINYWELDIERLPMLCEWVTVGTFPHGMKGFLANRNFYLKNGEGDYIVKANTLWTLLNLKEATPVRIPQEFYSTYALEEKLDMIYGSRKVNIPEGDEVSVAKRDSIVIQRHHLDSNKHVNNGQYVKLALASVEEDFDIASCKRFRIDYRKQAMLGDVIVPWVYKENQKIVVALKDEEDGVFSVAEME